MLLEDSNASNLIELFFEKLAELVASILDFYLPVYNFYLDFINFAYTETFGHFSDFIFNLLSSQSADFSIRGQAFVDSFFSKLNFADINFTDNFLFWFIGLLLFAFSVKIFLKLVFASINIIANFFFK